MQKKSAQGNSLFSRGYNAVRKKMSKNPKGAMSCNTCCHFYQDEKEHYETCHNPNVTEFDMVKSSSGMTYCNYWAFLKENAALKHIEETQPKLAHNLNMIARSFKSPAQKSRIRMLDEKEDRNFSLGEFLND